MAGDRRTRYLILGAAAIAALLVFRLHGPRAQHVRVVLGAKSAKVTALTLALHEHPDDDPLRRARFEYARGAAPRVASWDLEAPSGAYTVRVEAETTEGRRTVEREVTLAEGTASVDVVEALP
ncbi:MAG: hypothetical protein KC657_19780 [Myxococcales bacterium]|nr:hypothetical protein [Myxococcales bacterium]